MGQTVTSHTDNLKNIWSSGLFSSIICCPAISTPMERVFPQSGLILKPHQAGKTDISSKLGIFKMQQQYLIAFYELLTMVTEE